MNVVLSRAELHEIRLATHARDPETAGTISRRQCTVPRADARRIATWNGLVERGLAFVWSHATTGDPIYRAREAAVLAARDSDQVISQGLYKAFLREAAERS